MKVNERSSKTVIWAGMICPGLVGGLLVVGLRELDDVDAVGAERGADRRRGRGLPGRQLEREDDPDLLGHGESTSFPLELSTWRKSSSTGVSRPKMLTRTFTLFRSRFTSSTVPTNSANGPSVTRRSGP